MISIMQDVGLALRNLRRSPSRSAVAVMTVASGVIAFMLASGFIAWIFEQMREGTIRSQLGHAQIVRPGYFERGIADPYSFLLPEQAGAVQALRKVAGFQTLAPRLAVSGLVSHGEITAPFSGEGVEPVAEKPISTRMEFIQGRNLSADDDRKVVLGEGLAKSLGARVGDSVVLLTTAVSGSANAVELGVVGVFSTYSKEYDDYTLRFHINQARKLIRVAGATSWVVLLDQTDDTGRFVSLARQQFNTSDYEVVPWIELADFYRKTVELFSKQVDVVRGIIGLIIILTISNTLTMSVYERTTEIGTSLAIGLRRFSIMRLFVIEGLIVGLLGGLVGASLGYVLAQVISVIGIPMPPPPGMAHGYIGEILVTSALASDAVVLALLTTLLASLVPAWRASRLNIVDALRTNQ